MEDLDRYRFGVRILTALQMDGAYPHTDDQVIERRFLVMQSIINEADRIRIVPGLGVAGNIANLIRLVEETLASENDTALGHCLEGIRDQLVARRQSPRCARCTASLSEPPVCSRLANIQTVDAPQICIDELAGLLFAIKGKSHSLYLRHTAQADEVALTFSLRRIERGAQCGFIPEFHLDGSTDVDGRATLVEFVLEDHSLDLETLVQLAYVSAHELICHAYQGILGNERQNVSGTCSWSEGWMDSIAWHVLERWLRHDPLPLPDWLTSNPERALRYCRRLFERRYRDGQSRAMTPFNVQRREQARDACDELFRHWSAPRNSRTLNGFRKVVDFSIALNIASMNGKQREAMIVHLCSGLLAKTPNVLDRTIAACSDFMEDRDADRLLRELRLAGEYVYPRAKF